MYVLVGDSLTTKLYMLYQQIAKDLVCVDEQDTVH